jgi:hypothetical protein
MTDLSLLFLCSIFYSYYDLLETSCICKKEANLKSKFFSLSFILSLDDYFSFCFISLRDSFKFLSYELKFSLFIVNLFSILISPFIMVLFFLLRVIFYFFY